MKAGTLVYVSHPFTGDELANKEKAREAARAVMRISRSDLWYPDAVVVNPLDALTYMRNIYYVGAALGGDCFLSYKRPIGSMSRGRRIKSPALQVRDEREKAQADLDAWAKKKGLREVTEVEQDVKEA